MHLMADLKCFQAWVSPGSKATATRIPKAAAQRIRGRRCHARIRVHASDHRPAQGAANGPSLDMPRVAWHGARI